MYKQAMVKAPKTAPTILKIAVNRNQKRINSKTTRSMVKNTPQNELRLITVPSFEFKIPFAQAKLSSRNIKANWITDTKGSQSNKLLVSASKINGFWTVSASLGMFSGPHDALIQGSLNVPTPYGSITSGKDASIVASGKESKDGSIVDFSRTTLDLNPVNCPGKYTAYLTYTLTNYNASK